MTLRCHSESAEPRGWRKGRERWSAMRNPPFSWVRLVRGIPSSLASLSPQGRLFAALCPSHPHPTHGASPALDDSEARMCATPALHKKIGLTEVSPHEQPLR